MERELISLSMYIGVLIGLVFIILYCSYKYFQSLPEIIKMFKENIKAKKDLIKFLNEINKEKKC